MTLAASGELPPCDVVITAGGTGGHVFPALALADALVDAGLDRGRIGFVGGRRGFETTLVPQAGLAFVGLPVEGLVRKLSPANIRVALGFVRSVRVARRLLEASGARVVAGMGGYASLPAVWSARRAGVPVVLYESNSVPGLATRIGSSRAVTTATAFTATLGAVRHGQHIGFLVRPGFAGAREQSTRRVLADEARAAFGLPAGRRVVLCVGGSQGARTLNTAIVGLCGMWRARDDVAILHLTGRLEHDAVAARAQERMGEGSELVYVALAFEERMQLAYAVADLVVCRSGAATCAELAATGTPAICVPFPHAIGDHQRHNVEALAAAGAAEILDDDATTPAALGARIDALLDHPDRLEALASAARALGEAGAAPRLARLVLDAGGMSMTGSAQ